MMCRVDHSRGHVGGIATIGLLALLPLTCPSMASGQVGVTASRGDRLRVTSLEPGEETTVGVLVAVQEGTLLLQDDGRASVIPIPLDSVSLVEVSRGRKSQWARGLAWGFFAGAFVGALYGSANADTDAWDLPSEVAMGLGAVMVGVGGGLVGLAVGSSSYTEVWHPVNPGAIGIRMPPPSYGGVEFRLQVTVR